MPSLLSGGNYTTSELTVPFPLLLMLKNQLLPNQKLPSFAILPCEAVKRYCLNSPVPLRTIHLKAKWYFFIENDLLRGTVRDLRLFYTIYY